MAPRIRRASMPAADLRRRVRRITAASVGVAALASAGLTVNLAWAADDPAASSSSATGQAATTPSTTTSPRVPVPQLPTDEAGSEDGDDAQAPSPQQNVITTPSTQAHAPLVGPQQAPLVGKGRTHTQSGGS